MAEEDPKSKRADNTLALLRQKYELILEAAGEGIYGLDTQGNTTFVNPAAATMLGWTSEELIGQPMHSLLHHSRPDGSPYPAEQCPIYRAFKDGAVHQVGDEVFWRKDGGNFPVEYISTPMWENGELIGAVVVFGDITERQQAEKDLRESEARFRKLFEQSSDAIFLVEPTQDRILNANPKACDMLGYSHQELVSKHVSDIHPQEMPKFLAFAHSVSAQGHAQTDELTCFTRTGQRIAAEISASTFIDRGGCQLLLASVRDITERKQAESALREAHEEVQRLKDRLQAENVYLQEEIKTEHNFEEILGHSAALKKVLHQVEQVAATDATVLILGETGTGKELFARAVHNLSPRQDRPLVKVNCAALPPTLIESELFGHEKGAFTGALARTIGRFELADGGTIFLDEIGDLPLELQAKLLRVLQEGAFERVGGTHTIKVQVRVIAATNRDLTEEVRTGNFRPDLFYRLNVFPLALPPLRERKGDIPLLVNFLLTRYGQTLGKRFDGVSQATMQRLVRYSWPGNVRELENVIEHAAIMAKSPKVNIELGPALDVDASAQASSRSTLRDIERWHILRVLEEMDWRVSGEKGAATVLGLHPNTLQSRMQKLGIKRPTSMA